MKKRELAELIVSYFQLRPTQAFSLKQLFGGLKLTTHPLKMLCNDIVEEMTEDGFLTEPEKGHYKLNDKGQILTGTFQRKSNGKNTFTPDEGGTPIFIAERNSAHAMNGDRVRVALCARRKRKAPEGEVIEVLERAKTTFVGTLKVTKNYAFLLTESSTLANDIFIPKEKLKGGKNGDKAVVRITEWPDEAKNPFGEVIDVLGKAGDNTTEMHAILAEYGLPYTYPATVEAAAEKLSAEITPEDYAEREDFRGVTTFTIDPKDAKDFDDALSIRPLKPGLWEVGVHIADVSHYVKEGSAIDKEAVKRATSVYLVDRTIPMLPERLCNFICSLRPDEEKLAYSVIFNLNDQAEVKDYRIRHTVIKSDRRFTYEEAQAIIETGTGDFNYEILELNRLAQQLRARRMAAGSIDFIRDRRKRQAAERVFQGIEGSEQADRRVHAVGKPHRSGTRGQGAQEQEAESIALPHPRPARPDEIREPEPVHRPLRLQDTHGRDEDRSVALAQPPAERRIGQEGAEPHRNGIAPRHAEGTLLYPQHRALRLGV